MKPTRAQVIADAKALGLPATGKTEEIADAVRILKSDPSTWTFDEFRKVLPSLSIHQDLKPNSGERVSSIMGRGLDSGMVTGAQDFTPNSLFIRQSLKGGDAYLFPSGALKYRSAQDPHLAPGNKPMFHVQTKPGQDLYEAITGKPGEWK